MRGLCQAVEREKEKILQDRAAEREGLSELERREMLRQQQVERWYRDQCEALERTVQVLPGVPMQRGYVCWVTLVAPVVRFYTGQPGV